jgi:alkylated DNA repair protein (DNA oxidative demethylase)
MPAEFEALATTAAAAAGFADFAPNSCLINRYEPGARMGLHQDKDEGDFSQPIVSVSIGLPAIFLFGGESRTGPKKRFRLYSGDIVVWGGPARLVFHGIDALDEGDDTLTGRCRINLTFRRTL